MLKIDTIKKLKRDIANADSAMALNELKHLVDSQNLYYDYILILIGKHERLKDRAHLEKILHDSIQKYGRGKHKPEEIINAHYEVEYSRINDGALSLLTQMANEDDLLLRDNYKTPSLQKLINDWKEKTIISCEEVLLELNEQIKKESVVHKKILKRLKYSASTENVKKLYKKARKELKEDKVYGVKDYNVCDLVLSIYALRKNKLHHSTLKLLNKISDKNLK